MQQSIYRPNQQKSDNQILGTHTLHKHNDPQSAYALHILQNRQEYGLLKDTMTLLKPIHKSSMLIPYEQLLIQTFHQNGTLIPEQNCSEQNPLLLLATEHSFT